MNHSPISKTVINAWHNSKVHTVIHQGGTTSSKTWGILDAVIYLSTNNEIKNKIFTVLAPSIPHLKKGAMRDFQKILSDDGITSIYEENKTDKTFTTANNNIVEFVSAIDDLSKGGKRDFLFINEANLIDWSIARQFMVRTFNLTVIDYNPSASFWAHDLKGNSGVEFYISDITNNPAFNTPEIQKIYRDLEATKFTDPEFYRVYRLGHTGNVSGLIFRMVNYVPSFPECEKIVYGLDFGYTNDPTVLSKCGIHTGEFYGHECCYDTGMSDEDINQVLINSGVKKHDTIIADGSDPRLIAKLKKFGWNIKAAKKGADSVNFGITELKKYKINITVTSVNAKKEQQNYKWKEKDGVSLNIPIDSFNHFWDSVRYAGEDLFKQSFIPKFMTMK